MDEIYARLQPIFREVLDNEQIEITSTSSAKNIEEWDSLGHINLVSAIEQEFDVYFELGELEKLNNVGEMVELIKVKLRK